MIVTYHYNLFGSFLVALITLIAVAITFSNKSYTADIFNHKIFAFLGKFGFIMYLNNTFVRNFVQNLHPTWTYKEKFILYILIVLIISIISYIIVDVLLGKIKKYYQERKNTISLEEKIKEEPKILKESSKETKTISKEKNNNKKSGKTNKKVNKKSIQQ